MQGEKNSIKPWLGLTLICLWCVFAVVAQAEDSPSRDATLFDVNGSQAAGVPTQWGEGGVVLGGQSPRRWPLSDVVRLQWRDRIARRDDSQPVVLLSNGDILCLEPVAGDDETLTGKWVRFPAWDPLKVPLENVKAIVFHPPADASFRSRLQRQIEQHVAGRDLIILGNGDVVLGQYQGLNDKSLTISTNLGKSDLDRTGVRAVVFNPELVAKKSTREAEALVTLTDGSRLHGRPEKLSTVDILSLRPEIVAGLDVPLSSVESIRVLGPRVTYLSDREPESYQFTPLFGRKLTWQKDHNVTGGPLRLRGREFPKGLGVHSRSEITYRLDGKYRLFFATIGIDDSADGRGSVVFTVLLDGKRVYASPETSGRSEPLAIAPINVSGAKFLTLFVDFGADLDVADHADWCDPILIK